MEIKRLGDVVLKKHIIVADPCYEPDTWCTVRTDVKPGRYDTYMDIADCGDFGKRVAKLYITHKESVAVEKKVIGTAGVDSGQCGIWDFNKFRKHCKAIYNQVREITLNGKGGAFDSWGVVSLAGYGDGGYPVVAGYNTNGEVVSLEIVFLEEEEE